MPAFSKGIVKTYLLTKISDPQIRPFWAENLLFCGGQVHALYRTAVLGMILLTPYVSSLHLHTSAVHALVVPRHFASVPEDRNEAHTPATRDTHTHIYLLFSEGRAWRRETTPLRFTRVVFSLGAWFHVQSKFNWWWCADICLSISVRVSARQIRTRKIERDIQVLSSSHIYHVLNKQQ